MRQNCQAYIYIRVNDNGNMLEITRLCEDHNHDLNEILFNHLPNQRKVTPQVRSEIIEMMDLKANKKCIQNKIQSETGKVLTLRDLTNISRSGMNYINIILLFIIYCAFLKF